MDNTIHTMDARKIMSIFLRALRQMKPRTVVALLTLMVAWPRVLPGGAVSAIYPLKYFPQELFGWMSLIAGILLLVTHNMRLRLFGRLSAVFAFVVWTTLFVATTSWTSRGIDLVIMAILIIEILTPYDD